MTSVRTHSGAIFDLCLCHNLHERREGRTIDGAPATLRHWWLYVFALVPAAAALWLFVRVAHGQGWI